MNTGMILLVIFLVAAIFRRRSRFADAVFRAMLFLVKMLVMLFGIAFAVFALAVPGAIGNTRR